MRVIESDREVVSAVAVAAVGEAKKKKFVANRLRAGIEIGIGKGVKDRRVP